MSLVPWLALCAGAAPLAESYQWVPSPLVPDTLRYADSLASAGDVNGDGYGDVVIGHLPAVGVPGSAVLYFGTPTGLSWGIPLVNPNSAPTDRFSQVGVGGDIDGDGFDDVVVGAYTESIAFPPLPSTPTGAVYVYPGSAQGPLAPRRITAPDMAYEPVAPLFGVASLIADLDGDGFDELVVSATQADALIEDVGKVYVFPGTPSGPDTTNVTILADSVVPLGHYGERPLAPDLDADGVRDLLLYESWPSRRYYVHASAWAGTEITSPTTDYVEGAGVGDIDGDGVDELVQTGGTGEVWLDTFTAFTGTTYTTTHVTLTTDERPDALAVVDLDADGFDDVVIGAPYFEVVGPSGTSFANSGAVVVVYGGPDGLELATAQWVESPMAGVEEYFGYRVAAAGDVNGDGYGDFAVADYGVDHFLMFHGACDDLDGDGFCGRDCDDLDPDAFPGAAELESDVACMRDADGDGWGDAGAGAYEAGSDCDDADPDRRPDATEVPASDRDEDCDGIELCPVDLDDDGHAAASGAVSASTDVDCADPHEASAGDPADDCDDVDPAVHPHATELADDGVDQDCDGAELCLQDDDGDGYAEAGGATVLSGDLACDGPGEASLADPAGDCDDATPSVHPSADELVADGVDQDCDGAELCYVDADADGAPAGLAPVPGDLACADAGLTSTATPADCDDDDPGAFPAASEVPGDGIDQDCDGADAATAEDADADADAGAAGGGCGCATGAWGAAGWLGIGLLPFAARRRRTG